MLNDKYVVFKTDDFYGEGWLHNVGEPAPILDAVVIRRQDIFAGPGLFAYANAIQTAIDLLSITDKKEGDGGSGAIMAPVERLEDLRDFFWEQAMMAKDSPVKKVPD